MTSTTTPAWTAPAASRTSSCAGLDRTSRRPPTVTVIGRPLANRIPRSTSATGTIRTADIFACQSPATASAATRTDPGLTVWNATQSDHTEAVKKSAAARSVVMRRPCAKSVGQKA